ncbi:uncharacterized protein LOC125070624 [Vanessa atalanta]|uniref:uncharacterized protein LOC125070624 n=1 Tax=Vanessa atalanta TaxID=42275 RepID=UPI001FCD5D03|nr:uncharacterized protein LOC125070624 [Vanessa atalanta]
MSKIVTYTLVLFCGIYNCEQNYRQTERIILLIDHILINKKITKEIHESLMEFKNIIISRPINYHAMNFYRIDYATLVSMSSVIVTYTIILLQNMQ